MKVLLAISALTLSVVGASACGMQQSVEAKVDQTIVASITPLQKPAMSTSSDALPATQDQSKSAPEVKTQ